jgi:RHS repeat-associated protein
LSKRTNPDFANYYVRDAQGNALATYSLKKDSLYLIEQNLYGSSRLGVKNLAILAQIDTQKLELSDTLRIFEEFVGAKNYELSNHLGNVLATISDKTIFNTDHYNGIVYSAQLYYPFGWEIPTLSYTAKKYRFGFNGKEDDREWHAQDYGFRLYTPREGRFIGVDPITAQYPELTPYQFASNRPIDGVDLDGKEWDYTIDAQSKDIHFKVIVSLSIDPKLNLSSNVIESYKNAITSQFNQTLMLSSDGCYSGEVLFQDGLIFTQVKPVLAFGISIVDENGNMIEGGTWQHISTVTVLNADGSIKHASEVGKDAVHELIHTLRLDHPFGIVQTNDTKLIYNGYWNYLTYPETDPDIIYNIMNYGFMRINNNLLSDAWQQRDGILLTKGQINFMLKEIDLQKKGFGLYPKRNESDTQEKFEQEVNEKYLDYWDNIPGEPVKNMNDEK